MSGSWDISLKSWIIFQSPASWKQMCFLCTLSLEPTHFTPHLAGYPPPSSVTTCILNPFVQMLPTQLRASKAKLASVEAKLQISWFGMTYLRILLAHILLCSLTNKPIFLLLCWKLLCWVSLYFVPLGWVLSYWVSLCWESLRSVLLWWASLCWVLWS